MAEKPLTNRVLAAIRSHGGWAVKFLGSGMTAKGTPDVLGCVPWKCSCSCPCCGKELVGRFLGIEVKDGGRGGTAPSLLQVWTLEQIRAAGGIGKVVRTDEDYTGLLEEMSAHS